MTICEIETYWIKIYVSAQVHSFLGSLTQPQEESKEIAFHSCLNRLKLQNKLRLKFCFKFYFSKVVVIGLSIFVIYLFLLSRFLFGLFLSSYFLLLVLFLDFVVALESDKKATSYTVVGSTVRSCQFYLTSFMIVPHQKQN